MKFAGLRSQQGRPRSTHRDPTSGAADQLAEQVARIVSRPMDRDHPLWEVYVIEGLADGRWALLTKTPHATIDGTSGVLFLRLLTDTGVDGAATKFRERVSATLAPSADPAVPTGPFTPAPPTPWTRSITAHRRFAMRSASLANIKALKDATGGTVNDIVMATCAGALREYLLVHKPHHRCDAAAPPSLPCPARRTSPARAADRG